MAAICNSSLRPTQNSEAGEGSDAIDKGEKHLGKALSHVVHILLLLFLLTSLVNVAGEVAAKAGSTWWKGYSFVSVYDAICTVFLAILALRVLFIFLVRFHSGVPMFVFGLVTLALGILMGLEMYIPTGGVSAVLGAADFVTGGNHEVTTPQDILLLIAIVTFSLTLLVAFVGSIRHWRSRALEEQMLDKIDLDDIAQRPTVNSELVSYSSGHAYMERSDYSSDLGAGGNGWVSRLECREEHGCLLIRTTDLSGLLSNQHSYTVERLLSRIISSLIPTGKRGSAVGQFRDAFGSAREFVVLSKRGDDFLFGKMPWESPEMLVVPLSKTFELCFPAGTGIFDVDGLPIELELELTVKLKKIEDAEWKDLNGISHPSSTQIETLRKIQSTALCWVRALHQANYAFITQFCEISAEEVFLPSSISRGDQEVGGEQLALKSDTGKQKYAELLGQFLPPEVRELIEVEVGAVRVLSFERDECIRLNTKVIATDRDLKNEMVRIAFAYKVKVDQLIIKGHHVRDTIRKTLELLIDRNNAAVATVQRNAGTIKGQAIQAFSDSGVKTRGDMVTKEMQQRLAGFMGDVDRMVRGEE